MKRIINGCPIYIESTLKIGDAIIPGQMLSPRQKAAIMNGSPREAEEALQDLYINLSNFMAQLQQVILPQ